MSVTVSQYKNFVGGKWVDAVEGGTAEILNPATGETIAEVPRGTAGRRRPRGRGGQGGAAGVARDDAGRARRGAAQARRRDRGERRRARRSSSRRTSASRSPAARDEMPVSSDNLRFFAGAARLLEGKAAGEYMRGYTSMIRREPVGIVGQIAPWNYPLMMAVWKIAPGARGRQRRRAQAVRADAADDAAHGRARGRDPPAGRAERDHRRRRAGRRGHRPPPRRAAWSR